VAIMEIVAKVVMTVSTSNGDNSWWWKMITATIAVVVGSKSYSLKG